MGRTTTVRLGGAAAALAAVVLLSSCDYVSDDLLGPIGGGSIEVAWPEEGATLYGIETFRARLRDGRRLDDYEIFVSVEDDRWIEMWDDWYDRTPHKYYDVDVTRWSSRGRGPYDVKFEAEDDRGRLIARRTIRVYRD